jgi:hypothetical protein
MKSTRPFVLAACVAFAACSNAETPPDNQNDGGIHDAALDRFIQMDSSGGGDGAGQQDGTGPQDGAGQRDGTGQQDGLVTGATLHDINTGVIGDNVTVSIGSLVVIGIAKLDGATGANKCKYSAWVQDPTGTAPCGIKLYLTGATCQVQDGGSCPCQYPPSSGTEIDKVTTLGDVFTVVGTTSAYRPAVDGGTLPPQHEIVVTTLTKTGTGSVTPVAVTTGTPFAVNGTGYQDYEGMLIKYQPASAASVGTVDSYGAFTWSGAHFVGTYRFVYSSGLDGGTFPASNSTWSSITGIANPAYGGGLAPRQQSDFVP